MPGPARRRGVAAASLLRLAIFFGLNISGAVMTICPGLSPARVIVILGLPVPVPVPVCAQLSLDTVEGSPLLAVPLFILAADLVIATGVTPHLLDLAGIMVFGPIRGAVAQVSVVMSVIVSGIGETTGLKLLSLALPTRIARCAGPAQGIAGTCESFGLPEGPNFGTLIKPTVGMRSEEIAVLVAHPARQAPMAERIPTVMAVICNWREKTGCQAMMAFNMTDETDAMRRHSDLFAADNIGCVMRNLN